MKSNRTIVLEALHSCSKPVTTLELSHTTSLTQDQCYNALRGLRQQKKVVKIGDMEWKAIIKEKVPFKVIPKPDFTDDEVEHVYKELEFSTKPLHYTQLTYKTEMESKKVLKILKKLVEDNRAKKDSYNCYYPLVNGLPKTTHKKNLQYAGFQDLEAMITGWFDENQVDPKYSKFIESFVNLSPQVYNKHSYTDMFIGLLISYYKEYPNTSFIEELRFAYKRYTQRCEY